MSFYNELRRRVQRRHYLPDVLKDFIDRLEYIDQRSAGEEVLDPHSEKTLGASLGKAVDAFEEPRPKKTGRSRLTWYRLARQGDKDAVEWLISQHMHMLEKRDEELAHACTHIENLLPFARTSKMRNYMEKGKLNSGLHQRDPIVREAELFLNAEDDEL